MIRFISFFFDRRQPAVMKLVIHSPGVDGGQLILSLFCAYLTLAPQTSNNLTAPSIGRSGY